MAMRVNSSKNGMPASLPPTHTKRNGAETATVRLLTIEYAATLAIEPPSIPVTTGAAVAVGQNTQMKAACANGRLNGLRTAKSTTEPTVCTARSRQIIEVSLRSDGLILQNVIKSIVKMRYGTITCKASMALWKRTPKTIASGSTHGFSFCLNILEFISIINDTKRMHHGASRIIAAKLHFSVRKNKPGVFSRRHPAAF